MIKKIAVGVVVLLVIVGGVVGYIWTNLDGLIRQAIIKYGTAATQTAVNLDSVKLSVTSGEGSLGGLSVANPKGFNADVQAFYLGSIKVVVNTSSIEGTGPIVIKEIDIEKPRVNYEITRAGNSNLSALQQNAASYANSMSGKTNAPPGKAPGQPETEKEKKESRKVIIDDLYVRNGEIGISTELLGNKNFTAPLPEIHLTNIGKDSGGATAGQVASQLINSITTSVGKVATGIVTNNLIGMKDLKTLGGTANDAATNAKSQIKSLFGN